MWSNLQLAGVHELKKGSSAANRASTIALCRIPSTLSDKVLHSILEPLHFTRRSHRLSLPELGPKSNIPLEEHVKRGPKKRKKGHKRHHRKRSVGNPKAPQESIANDRAELGDMISTAAKVDAIAGNVETHQVCAIPSEANESPDGASINDNTMQVAQIAEDDENSIPPHQSKEETEAVDYSNGEVGFVEQHCEVVFLQFSCHKMAQIASHVLDGEAVDGGKGILRCVFVNMFPTKSLLIHKMSGTWTLSVAKEVCSRYVKALLLVRPLHPNEPGPYSQWVVTLASMQDALECMLGIRKDRADLKVSFHMSACQSRPGSSWTGLRGRPRLPEMQGEHGDLLHSTSCSDDDGSENGCEGEADVIAHLSKQRQQRTLERLEGIINTICNGEIDGDELEQRVNVVDNALRQLSKRQESLMTNAEPSRSDIEVDGPLHMHRNAGRALSRQSLMETSNAIGFGARFLKKRLLHLDRFLGCGKAAMPELVLELDLDKPDTLLYAIESMATRLTEMEREVFRRGSDTEITSVAVQTTLSRRQIATQTMTPSRRFAPSSSPELPPMPSAQTLALVGITVTIATQTDVSSAQGHIDAESEYEQCLRQREISEQRLRQETKDAHKKLEAAQRRLQEMCEERSELMQKRQRLVDDRVRLHDELREAREKADIVTIESSAHRNELIEAQVQLAQAESRAQERLRLAEMRQRQLERELDRTKAAHSVCLRRLAEHRAALDDPGGIQMKRLKKSKSVVYQVDDDLVSLRTQLEKVEAEREACLWTADSRAQELAIAREKLQLQSEEFDVRLAEITSELLHKSVNTTSTADASTATNVGDGHQEVLACASSQRTITHPSSSTMQDRMKAGSTMQWEHPPHTSTKRGPGLLNTRDVVSIPTRNDFGNALPPLKKAVEIRARTPSARLSASLCNRQLVTAPSLQSLLSSPPDSMQPSRATSAGSDVCTMVPSRTRFPPAEAPLKSTKSLMAHLPRELSDAVRTSETRRAGIVAPKPLLWTLTVVRDIFRQRWRYDIAQHRRYFSRRRSGTLGVPPAPLSLGNFLLHSYLPRNCGYGRVNATVCSLVHSCNRHRIEAPEIAMFCDFLTEELSTASLSFYAHLRVNLEHWLVQQTVSRRRWVGRWELENALRRCVPGSGHVWAFDHAQKLRQRFASDSTTRRVEADDLLGALMEQESVIRGEFISQLHSLYSKLRLKTTAKKKKQHWSPYEQTLPALKFSFEGAPIEQVEALAQEVSEVVGHPERLSEGLQQNDFVEQATAMLWQFSKVVRVPRFLFDDESIAPAKPSLLRVLRVRYLRLVEDDQGIRRLIRVVEESTKPPGSRRLLARLQDLREHFEKSIEHEMVTEAVHTYRQLLLTTISILDDTNPTRDPTAVLPSFASVDHELCLTEAAVRFRLTDWLGEAKFTQIDAAAPDVPGDVEHLADRHDREQTANAHNMIQNDAEIGPCTEGGEDGEQAFVEVLALSPEEEEIEKEKQQDRAHGNQTVRFRLDANSLPPWEQFKVAAANGPRAGVPFAF